MCGCRDPLAYAQRAINVNELRDPRWEVRPLCLSCGLVRLFSDCGAFGPPTPHACAEAACEPSPPQKDSCSCACFRTGAVQPAQTKPRAQTRNLISSACNLADRLHLLRLTLPSPGPGAHPELTGVHARCFQRSSLLAVPQSLPSSIAAQILGMWALTTRRFATPALILAQ